MAVEDIRPRENHERAGPRATDENAHLALFRDNFDNHATLALVTGLAFRPTDTVGPHGEVWSDQPLPGEGRVHLAKTLRQRFDALPLAREGTTDDTDVRLNPPNKQNLEARLRVALAVLDTVLQLHRKRTYHRRLTPECILLVPRTFDLQHEVVALARLDRVVTVGRGQAPPGPGITDDETLPDSVYLHEDVRNRKTPGPDARLLDLFACAVMLYEALHGTTPHVTQLKHAFEALCDASAARLLVRVRGESDADAILDAIAEFFLESDLSQVNAASPALDRLDQRLEGKPSLLQSLGTGALLLLAGPRVNTANAFQRIYQRNVFRAQALPLVLRLSVLATATLPALLYARTGRNGIVEITTPVVLAALVVLFLAALQALVKFRDVKWAPPSRLKQALHHGFHLAYMAGTLGTVYGVVTAPYWACVRLQLEPDDRTLDERVQLCDTGLDGMRGGLTKGFHVPIDCVFERLGNGTSEGTLAVLRAWVSGTDPLAFETLDPRERTTFAVNVKAVFDRCSPTDQDRLVHKRITLPLVGSKGPTLALRTDPVPVGIEVVGEDAPRLSVSVQAWLDDPSLVFAASNAEGCSWASESTALQTVLSSNTIAVEPELQERRFGKPSGCSAITLSTPTPSCLRRTNCPTEDADCTTAEFLDDVATFQASTHAPGPWVATLKGRGENKVVEGDTLDQLSNNLGAAACPLPFCNLPLRKHLKRERSRFSGSCKPSVGAGGVVSGCDNVPDFAGSGGNHPCRFRSSVKGTLPP